MSNKAEEKCSINPIIRNAKNFIYKGRIYPISFDLVKINSNYFYSNCEKFTEENIEFQEEIEISEFAFLSFINCCENKEFTINESNVFQLDYLSKKYEVPELTKVTQKFISRPNTKLAFESLHFKIQLQNNCKTQSEKEVQFIDTSKEEEIIGDRLNEYINDERLSDFPIPVIHRILTKYMNKNKDKNDNGIIDFLFKCLDKHKRKASVLFLNIDIENQRKDLFIRLLRDYNDIFDFNMINLKTILNTTSELTKELITIKKEYEEKIKEMKQIIIEQKEEIKQFNESFLVN